MVANESTALISAVAAIISAGVALCGVALGSWLKSRAQHRDRAMALKREVFMPAADAIIGLNAKLLQLADLEVAATNSWKEALETTSKLSAVDIVANPSTIAAKNEFLFGCVAANVVINVQRRDLERRGVKPIKPDLVKVQFIDKLLAEVSKWEKTDDPAVRDQRHKKLDEILARENETSYNEAQLLIALLVLCLAKAKEVSELVPPVILAFRAELGLPIDKQEYLKVWRESTTRTYEAIESTIEILQDFLGEAKRRDASQAPRS
jgi:hypothetical protein